MSEIPKLPGDFREKLGIPPTEPSTPQSSDAVKRLRLARPDELIQAAIEADPQLSVAMQHASLPPRETAGYLPPTEFAPRKESNRTSTIAVSGVVVTALLAAAFLAHDVLKGPSKTAESSLTNQYTPPTVSESSILGSVSPSPSASPSPSETSTSPSASAAATFKTPSPSPSSTVPVGIGAFVPKAIPCTEVASGTVKDLEIPMIEKVITTTTTGTGNKKKTVSLTHSTDQYSFRGATSGNYKISACIPSASESVVNDPLTTGAFLISYDPNQVQWQIDFTGLTSNTGVHYQSDDWTLKHLTPGLPYITVPQKQTANKLVQNLDLRVFGNSNGTTVAEKVGQQQEVLKYMQYLLAKLLQGPKFGPRLTGNVTTFANIALNHLADQEKLPNHRVQPSQGYLPNLTATYGQPAVDPTVTFADNLTQITDNTLTMSIFKGGS